MYILGHEVTYINRFLSSEFYYELSAKINVNFIWYLKHTMLRKDNISILKREQSNCLTMLMHLFFRCQKSMNIKDCKLAKIPSN